jgi:protein ImuB
MIMLLCVRVRQYELAASLGVLRQDKAELPWIIVDHHERGHVLAVNDAASADGARAGQTLTQAAAAAPRARIVVYDAARGNARWQEMLDELDAVTPLVDDVRTGIAFLDMRGIPGERQAWMEQVHRVLERFAMPFSIGAGPNKFCAYAATWISDAAVIDAGDAQQRLAPLPLDVIASLDPDAKERLSLLGVTTLGELARLPHGPFVRRFGPVAAQWHDWARGIDRTPLIPRAHAAAIEASIFGEGHADEEEQVLFALRLLLIRICADLERCGKRTSLLQLDVELEDGQVCRFDVLLPLPTADDRAMLDVLRAKLESSTFAAPLVGLRLRALRLEEGGEAMPLFARDEIDVEHVAAVLTRLEAAIGEPVRRAKVHAAHALENRFSYEPFSFSAPVIPSWSRETPQTTSSAFPQLRLSAVKEIDVRLMRGGPAFVGSHAVLECTGPWRIQEGWFASPVARDEYDVLLETGEMCRIYRQGQHWYMRGAYD